jgi:hypothetical protein
MKPKALLTALLCALALISCGGNKEASYRMDYTVALDTAGAIDYDAYLQDAGLFVDTESWAIRRVENPTPAQAAFLESLDLI